MASGNQPGLPPMQRLWTIAACGNVAELRDLIAENHAAESAGKALFDYGAADSSGLTALMHAVRGGHVECVRALLANGGRTVLETINNTTADNSECEGRSVLHFAAHSDAFLGTADAAGDWESAQADTVAALLAAGANPNLFSAKTSNAETPVHVASRCAGLAALKLIVAAGGDVNIFSKGLRKTALLSALQWSTTPHVLEFILDCGADIGAVDAGGSTAMHLCTQSDDATLLDLLVSRGGNVNAAGGVENDLGSIAKSVNEGQYTRPVDEAGDDGNADDDEDREVVEKPQKSGNKKRPLHHFLYHTRKSPAVLAALLRHGADPNAPDDQGNTPLQIVDMGYGDASTRAALIAGGADDWMTPLDDAVKAQDVERVATALKDEKAAAWVNPTSSRKSDPPLLVAVRSKRGDIAKMLLDAGARATLTGMSGDSAVTYAVLQAQPDMLRVLLDSGLDPNFSVDDDSDGSRETNVGGGGTLRDGCTRLLHWALQVKIDDYNCDDDDDFNCDDDDDGDREDDDGDGDDAGNDVGGENEDPDDIVKQVVKSKAAAQKMVDHRQPGEGELAVAAMVDLLLSHGAYHSPRDRHGCTPLHYAATYLNAEGAVRLIAAGADPLAATNDGLSVFSLFAQMDLNVRQDVPDVEQVFRSLSADAAYALFSRRAKIDEHDDNGVDDDAVNYDSDVSEVGKLVGDWSYRASGFSADDMESINPSLVRLRAILSRAADMTSSAWALHDAICKGDPYAAAHLLSEGHDPLRPDRYGLRPMYYACRHSDPALARALIDAGCPVNAPCTPSHNVPSPIYVAALYGNADVVTALIDAGADVNARGRSVSAPSVLHAAVLGGNTALVDALLLVGVDPNSTPEQGFAGSPVPPLLLACMLGRGEIATRLRRAGAAVKCGGGRVLLHFARGLAVAAVLAMGENCGPVHARDDFGRTPLHLSARRGDAMTTAALISAGADTDVLDAYRRSPLWYAQRTARAKGRGGPAVLKKAERFCVAQGLYGAMQHADVAALLIAAGGAQ